MHDKNPLFGITNTMLDEIAAIELLHRAKRISSIYSSRVIEENTLSMEQVTTVLNGKWFIASPKDITDGSGQSYSFKVH